MLYKASSKNTQTVTVNAHDASYKMVKERILSSPRLQDDNTFDNPDRIAPKAFAGAALKGNMLSVKVPPFSVVVPELK